MSIVKNQVKTKYVKASDKIKAGEQWRYNYEPSKKLSLLITKEAEDVGCSYEKILNDRLERDYKAHPHKKRK